MHDELVHVRVSGEVNDRVARREVELDVLHRQVLQQIRELVGPCVRPLVDAEHFVPVALQAQCQVRADLPRRAGDEDAHQREATRNVSFSG